MKRGDVVTVAATGDYGKPRPAVIVQTDALPVEHASVVVPNDVRVQRGTGFSGDDRAVAAQRSASQVPGCGGQTCDDSAREDRTKDRTAR